MNKKEVYVAVLDSGCSFDTHEKVAIKKCGNKMKVTSQAKICSQHGEVIAGIIASNEQVKLYDIQIFDEKLQTTAHHLLKALHYLLDKKVDIIHMSLGLTTNYEEIEAVCAELIKKGVTLIASYPRSGETEVFPASYEGVIAVSSEGACKEFEIIVLDKEKELFAANPHSKVSSVAGSSVSVAKFTKVFSEYISMGLCKDEIIEKLKKESIK